MNKPATIKVAVNLVIEVSPEAWQQAYGLNDESVAALRADVKNYALGTVASSAPAHEGGIVSVELRK